MAKYAWPVGSTSKTVLLFLQDSAATTGAGKVSVSAGNINVQGIRVQTDNTVTRVTISVTNLAALTDAFLSGGIFPVDPVNTPGWYRFDIPDAVLAAGAITAAVSILGTVSASNIAQLALEIQLQNTPADMVAKAGVTVSVSTLFPALVRQWDTTSVSSSNLAVTDFTTRVNANVQQWGGTSVSTNNIVLRSEISLSVVNVTAWAGVSVTTSNIALWRTLSAVNVTQWATVSVSASNFALVDASARVNANVQQWVGASVSSVNLFDTTAIYNALVGLPVDVVLWQGAATATDDIALFNAAQLAAAVNAITVNVGTWAGASVSASNFALLNVTGAVAESYAADGADFTIPQALYQIWARLSEFSISAQVITAFKLDGVTPAMTFSLDSATAPTKVERVT